MQMTEEMLSVWRYLIVVFMYLTIWKQVAQGTQLPLETILSLMGKV